MSGNAVGFAFQADVASSSSLVHLLTGRALKALSDGGVDFYSVLAAVTLGKSFTVRSALGNTVRSHITSRGGIQSVLSKALSIGWGHSGLAIEMTQTQAGTNAMLLIGALATGSTHYQAAECLSDLLSLRGCEADKLPNVDVLKHMIGYLAPFVHDLGFSKVLEHVTTAAMRAINTERRNNSEADVHLTRRGDASGTAGAINQLMLTSQKGESIYMITRIRGAWFSAFAAHILGMSVELRLNDAVIWATAGSNGKAIFELGEHQISEFSVQTTPDQKITLADVSDPDDKRPVTVEYLIGDAFSSLVAREPRINAASKDAISKAICRLLLGMLTGYIYSPKLDPYPRFESHFKMHEGLRETLEAFGFKGSLIDSVTPYMSRTVTPYISLRLEDDCLSALDDDAQCVLIKACEIHRGVEPARYKSVSLDQNAKCLCTYIDSLLFGFVFSVISLMRCRFDASQLRLREDVLLGKFGPAFNLQRDNKRAISGFSELIDIMLLISGDVDQLLDRALGLNEDHSIVGLSNGSHTVCLTCVLRNDCFDNQGRFLTLWSGRASLNGTQRSLIVDKHVYNRSSPPQMTALTSLAPGSILEPHYCPSNMKIYMNACLTEEAISLQLMVGLERLLAQPVNFFDCILDTLDGDILRCPHDPRDKFQVARDQNLAIVGFPIANEDEQTKKPIQLVALHGNKLEQLLANWLIDFVDEEFIFQLFACLKCCVTAAERSGCKYVVMGG
ncbi:hypothetical protein F5Y13DRAFT_196182 [Hypoxylon sp. FL1857]|nr:hypothetical protein F5Y13DRAFT_196182 [Hypoxylon sp. FL1857]